MVPRNSSSSSCSSSFHTGLVSEKSGRHQLRALSTWKQLHVILLVVLLLLLLLLLLLPLLLLLVLL